ncbi:MAG: hypothetical protein KDA41_20375, partial [Planctomycetales bacterium]|nr:hypothetical protein [Planctomycetales bacterium]
ALLAQVCRAPSESDWPVQAAYDAIAALAGAAPEAVAVLREALADPNANGAAGWQWATASFDAGAHGMEVELRERRGDTPAAERATQTYLLRMAQTNKRQQLSRFIESCHDWLQASDVLWGAAGHAITCVRNWKYSVQWHAGWEARTGARPWMLVNAAEALRSLGRDEEAVACSRHALEMPPDNGTRLHRLLLIADAACAGDLAYVDAHLAEVDDRESLDLDYKFLLQLVEAVREVAAKDAPRGAFGRAAKMLAQAQTQYAAHLPHEPNRQRFLNAARRQIASLVGTWWASMWCYGKRRGWF